MNVTKLRYRLTHWLERWEEYPRRRLVANLVLASFVLVAGLVSTHQSIKAILASVHLLIDLEDHSLINSEGSDLFRKRSIQKHFLRYGIYIPIDDVIITQGEHDVSLYSNLLQESCGKAKLYVWVPLRFRLPLVGEKVSEWCLVKN